MGERIFWIANFAVMAGIAVMGGLGLAYMMLDTLS
jgi:hypothetical protein